MKEIEYFFTTSEDGNIAYHTGDDKSRVDENRKLLAKKYTYDYNKLIYMQQMHGNNVQIVDKNSPRLIKNCDGIITNERDLVLMVMVADCVPILFMDNKEGVIGAVHAGRNSTFLKISQITVEKMIKHFSCKVENIQVVMGPSIHKCCYEVDDSMINIVKNTFGEEFIHNQNIDLQGINKKLLNDLGVFDIKILDICTRCSNKEFFSYRKNKTYKRFAGMIKII